MASQDVITLIREVYDTGRASPGRCERLSQLQRSDEAWSVCTEILRSSPAESSYVSLVTFAAVTLKRKVKRDLHILPANTHEPLKCLIVDSLVKFAQSKPICTQLCISLAYLILQSDQWSDPIITVTSSLPDNQEKASIMVEYFTILAEELNGMRDVKIGRNRRDLLRKQLESVASDVNQFLLATLWQAEENGEQKLRILKNVVACFTVWIDSGLLDERVLLASDAATTTPGTAAADSDVPIVSVLFKYLLDFDCDEDLHDACTECLCTLLQVSGENVGSARNLLARLNVTVLQKIPLQLGPIEKWAADVTRVIFNLLKILVSLGYSLLNVYRLNIPDDAVNDTRILTCLLEYSQCTNPEVADIMLTFWAELDDCLLDRGDNNLEPFYPIVCKLVDVLLVQVRLPANVTAAPSSSYNSELFRIRRHSQNIMHSIVCLLGLDQCCKRLCAELSTEDWIKAESVVTLLWACGARLSELERSSREPPESPEIRQILEGFVFQIQAAHCHPALAATCVELLNSLSRWLAGRTDLLVKTMDFLFKLLPDTAQSACAKAILSLCLANPTPLISSLPIFMEATVSALRTRNVSLSQTTVLSLVKATAHLIMYAGRDGKVPPLDTLMAAFSEDLQYSLQNTEGAKRQRNKEIISRLDRICAFFRISNQSKQESDKQTIRVILQSMHTCLWPQLTSCLMHEYVDIVEASCNIFRYAIRLSGPAFEPLAESMIETILKSFQHTRNSCMLYLASVLLDELGSQPCPWLEHLVNGPLIGEVLDFLSTKENFRKNPDMVDDFFRLCKRLVQRRPALFLSHPQGKRAFDLAVENCVFEHPDALPSLMDFLAAVCTAERSQGERLYFSDVNTLKTVISKMLAAVAHDDLLESTRVSYAEFLCSLDEGLNRDILIKAIENALVELPRNRGSLGTLVDDEQLTELVVKLRNGKGIESLKHFLMNLAELFL